MFRKAIIALALLIASADAQVAKKVASFQVCGQYLTGGNSALDAANYAANAYPPTTTTTPTANWNTWKSGGAVVTGPLFAGPCTTTAQSGNGIGRVVDICDPNVWQPITANIPCTLTRTTGTGAGAPNAGTCPGISGTTYTAPTADTLKTFCEAAKGTAFPTAATNTAWCRGEIDIIGTGKYAGHTLVYDYQLTPTYTALQGAHTTTSANNIAAGDTINSYVACVYYPSFATSTGRAISASGKYFKNSWIKKVVASVTVAPTRIGTIPTSDFVVATVTTNTANANLNTNARVPVDTTGIQWAETITVTYVKSYYSLTYL